MWLLLRPQRTIPEAGTAKIRGCNASESRAMETGPGGWFIFPGAVQWRVLPLVRRVIFPTSTLE